MPELDDFVGHDDRECGDHRTVGQHCAWCFDCSEWCYPQAPCKGCELPTLHKRVKRMAEAARAAVEWHRENGHRQLDQPTQALADVLAEYDKGMTDA
jgi:hypothetical protein